MPTSLGELRIRSFCTPEDIRKLSFDRQFGTHAHYRSLYTKRESLERKAEQPDTSVVLAIADSTHIVGFGVLAYPDPEERWAGLQPQVMMEVNAIEVSRQWRSKKIAKGIIQMMMVHPLIEEKIAYFVGYSWTWDLDGNQMSAQQYRQMMARLFEPVRLPGIPDQRAQHLSASRKTSSWRASARMFPRRSKISSSG
ncbi:MAG: hypothetical protein MZV70_67430 [Desulfobacterales bacterium]|nr:hypothetical protein [Desulfobacterales bacterium]